MIEQIEAGYFINFIINKKSDGIKKYLKYVEQKKNIFINKDEFNNFEKLMILVTLFDLVNKQNIKFLRLYDLPISSPFLASEKIFLDIIKEINENSGLYFFYLQINSSSEIDYSSLKTWYPIKYIPLIEIKTHLLYSRFRFFFVYNEQDNIPAFLNPQTLIKSFNVSENSGYTYQRNLENEESINNTAKLLIYKLHENSHSKFECGQYSALSPRYLYSYNLKELDIHYNSIIKFKKGEKMEEKDKKTDEEGEEGYAMEMFLYGDYKKTDILLETDANLAKLCDSKLYSSYNFEELNKIISEILNETKKSSELTDKINKKYKNLEKEEKNNNIVQKKDHIYFFHNCSKEARY